MSTAASPSINQNAAQFIAQTKKLLINGKWVEAQSGKTFETYDPATGEVLTHCAAGDKADIDLAVAAARKMFDDPKSAWRRMSPSERGRCLWRLADLIEQNADEFATLETLDNGKPLTIARGADVALAIDLFRYMAGWATKIEGNTIPMSAQAGGGRKYFAYTLREPVGVVGQIIPWNFPLLMAAWKLGPALAAGCTVVLKPAEQTPLSALRLGELISQAGIPDGVVNIVTGFGETAGASLAAHEDVDKVAFTGSTEVGKLILDAAKGNLKKVSLELGGKSPNIVFEDADMDAAVKGAAMAIFFNQGQCCCAGSRLYVENKIFDKFVDDVSNRAKKIKVGPGLDPATQMGPLTSQEQFDRVTRYLEIGQKEGARAVTGGNRVGERGYFVEPTVLVDTDPKSTCVQEEIFGPVLVAIPFKDPDEVITHAHDTQYGLAAGVWTKDVSKAHRTAELIKAGTVWVNCYNVFDAALPFGGYKQSGWGREMGHDVLDLYTQKKSICMPI
jgi:phenylacetaldehyde dehydrogenase